MSHAKIESAMVPIHTDLLVSHGSSNYSMQDVSKVTKKD